MRRVLPRTIASFEAFENAMTLDIAMGGSTNTVLHLLAAAQEAEVDFTMADIDRLSRTRAAAVQGRTQHQTSTTWKTCTAPAASIGILGELDRAGMLHTDVPTVHSKTIEEALDTVGHRTQSVRTKSKTFYKAGPAGIPTQVAFSQATRWPSLDVDRAEGCIRSVEHAFVPGRRLGRTVRATSR